MRIKLIKLTKNPIIWINGKKFEIKVSLLMCLYYVLGITIVKIDPSAKNNYKKK